MNVFDKPRAEANLFGLCRGEKRCMIMNVFDKPRAEANLFGLCRGEKRGMKKNIYSDKNVKIYRDLYLVRTVEAK